MGAIGMPEIDPVCGMKLDCSAAQHRFEHRGKTFHFCSGDCQTQCVAAEG